LTGEAGGHPPFTEAQHVREGQLSATRF